MKATISHSIINSNIKKLSKGGRTIVNDKYPKQINKSMLPIKANCNNINNIDNQRKLSKFKNYNALNITSENIKLEKPKEEIKEVFKEVRELIRCNSSKISTIKFQEANQNSISRQTKPAKIIFNTEKLKKHDHNDRADELENSEQKNTFTKERNERNNNFNPILSNSKFKIIIPNILKKVIQI